MERPHWHVDAKWLVAIFLLPLLAATLAALGLYRITDERVAVPALALGFAAFVSPEGVDSDEGLAELRAKLERAPGKRIELIPELGISVTAEELEGRSPREARMLVFGKFAEPFYRGGAKEVAARAGVKSPEAVARFERDAQLLSVFTRASHDRLRSVLLGLALACLLLVALLVRFSARLGRLASPGFVLLLAGLPGLVLSAVIAANEGARDRTGYVISELSPTVLEPLRQQYVIVGLVGAGLLVAAGLGKLARRLGPAWATTR
jgi:hypothetical protein